MMNSDDERDVDVESDEERRGSKHHDKRAHHNALERKRRDHIKESFSSLRDAIPTMKGDKSSRAQILKSASEYINFMRQKQNSHGRDVDDLKRQNEHIEAQIKALERAKNSGTFSSAREVLNSNGLDYEVPAPTAAATADYAADEGAGGGTEVSYVEQGGSGSDSNGSDSNVPSSRGATGGITVVQAGGRGQPQPLHRTGTTTTTVTVQPAGSQLRPIQPGQSLLIMSSAEPAKKKFKQ